MNDKNNKQYHKLSISNIRMSRRVDIETFNIN